MSKRSITYTKPEEPNFLKRLKEQAGYQEGPTVETKRQRLGPAEDLSDCEDEGPAVVVLEEGDLTAEQAEEERRRKLKEAEDAKADLNERVIFKPPAKKTTEKKSGEKEKSKKKSRPLLSFDEEEEDA